MSADSAARQEAARQLLRHTVATLAYRAEKVLRDVPEGFADFKLSPVSRTALEILAHLADLMEWGERVTNHGNLAVRHHGMTRATGFSVDWLRLTLRW